MFSILIPTADRPHLLQHSLQSCLAIERDDVEIIVSDNFSAPEAKAVVDAFSHDRRLRYFRTDRRLSMPRHWDFAWTKARGEFVIFNCDDDGLSPSGLDMIARAIEEFGASIVSWPTALYLHPDYDAEGGPNLLLLRPGHSGLFLRLDIPAVIARYARFDFEHFPRGTSFCIARELGENVRNLTGRLFWAPAPDFSAPLLALAAAENGQYCYIDSLLGFGGRSRASNAGGFNAQNVEGTQRLNQFFSEFGDDDVYPHHQLKANFYLNAHFATVSLLKKFYPRFADLSVDTPTFFRAAYAELFGLRRNPLICERDRELLDEYIAGLDEHHRRCAAKARAEIRVRRLIPQFANGSAKWLLTKLGLMQARPQPRQIRGSQHGSRMRLNCSRTGAQ